MLQITVNNNKTIAIAQEDGQWTVDDKAVSLDAQLQPNGIINVLYNNKSYTAIVESVDKSTKEVKVRIDGVQHTVSIKEKIDQLLESMGMDLSAMQKVEPIKAPMPGMILKVLVQAGQQIEKGDGLLILEAMKMENILKATASATVKSVNVTEKTAVEKGAVLIEME